MATRPDGSSGDETTSAQRSSQSAESLRLLEGLLAPPEPSRSLSAERAVPEEITYLDSLHQAVFSWYAQAETKAQALLGFTGIFLSIFVSALIITPSGPQSVTYPWALLLFTILSYAASIILSVNAIWSRGMWARSRKGIVFFGAMAAHQDEKTFAEAVKMVIGTEEHVRQITASMYTLARNTQFKHRIVNVSAAFSGAGLVSTMLLLFFR